MLQRKRRGQALVEMALTVPILLILLIGIIDAGWIYNHQLILTNASREGARVGALNEDDDTVRSAVTNYLTQSDYKPMPAAGDITIDQAGDTTTVQLRSTVPFLFGRSGPAITLQAETRMRRE